MDGQVVRRPVVGSQAIHSRMILYIEFVYIDVIPPIDGVSFRDQSVYTFTQQ
jgi:hypothetical protein